MARYHSDTLELEPRDTAPPLSTPNRHGSTSVERVLAAVCTLPADRGAKACVQHLLIAFAEVLPGYALAVQVLGTDPADAFILRLGAESDPGPADDPSSLIDRVFPALAHERVSALPCRRQPASFHCAGDDPGLDDDSSRIAAIVDQCASALCSAIRNADAVELAHQRLRQAAYLEQMVIQADKLASLGELSASLVHELTNPLTTIVAYSDYLKQKSLDSQADAEDVERLGRISEAASRILTFTRALISYARPSGDVPIPVNIPDVVQQALAFCQHTIEKAGVTVERRIAPNLPLVRALPVQLTQVFVNLITNACQAMGHAGGMLVVEVSAQATHVCVKLTDTGSGIRNEHLDEIFEPFFTTKGREVGTGLGLSIVRNIVSAHGGRIRVESALGRGSVFTIMLNATSTPPGTPL